MTNVEYRCLHPMEKGAYVHKRGDDDEGTRVCGARLYAAPGGTNLSCPQHGEKYTQVEQWQGPLFEYVDEQGKTHRRTSGIRADAVNEGGQVKAEMVTDKAEVNSSMVTTAGTPDIDVVVTGEDENESLADHAWRREEDTQDESGNQESVQAKDATREAELEALRDEYREVFGDEPDRRFREGRLREEIDNRRAEIEAENDMMNTEGDDGKNEKAKGESANV